MSAAPTPRENLLERTSERWRPPVFSPAVTRRDRWVAAMRRVFDLQAGSIWRDLREELRGVTGRVLDVGCGAQPYRGLLPAGADYLGIDTADADARFGYRRDDTRYYTGDRWPVDDASIDVVLCSETLEHVPDTEQFLGEMRRCLRPGGRVILTVPFAARWHFIPHDYWRFTPSGLGAVLRRAGFQRLAVYARGNALTVACYKQMALILPLLLPQASSAGRRAGAYVAGLVVAPWFLLMALVGNASLRWGGGDDCLGYTVLAERGPDDAGGRVTA